MALNLVLCGGTGAHVGVAFLRLHTLAHFVGLLEHLPEFPQIFLLDQDAGTGIETEATAWDVARTLVNAHPGITHRTAVEISPLPLGANGDWFRNPNNKVANRFEGSALRDVMLSERQSGIDMSQGMMASPAAGSLLFRLKVRDVRGGNLNNDQSFGGLLSRAGTTAVFGSSVGGTGASVGPTVAKLLGDAGHSVLAVMLLNWFRLTASGDPEKQNRAQVRNNIMMQNEASALAYYEAHLASNIAVLPLGVPETARRERAYTGDLQQPMKEHFVHALAALAAFNHFAQRKDAGIYTYGTANPGSFDPTLSLDPDDASKTIQLLTDRAKWLIEFATLCRSALELGNGGVPEARLVTVLRALYPQPDVLASEFKALAEHLQEQLNWVESTLSIRPQGPNGAASPTLEAAVAAFLKQSTPQPHRDAKTCAYELMRWAGRYASSLPFPPKLRGAGAVRHQLPDLLFRDDAQAPPAPRHGEITRVDQGPVLIKGLVAPERLAVNGWPDPLAYATFFEHQINVGALRERRMLQFMLAGFAKGLFELKPVALPNNAGPLTLEKLLTDAAHDGDRRWDQLSAFQLVWPGKGERGADLVIGSTSPSTLFVSRPFMNDERDARVWGDIAASVAGAPDKWDNPQVFPLDRPWPENHRDASVCANWCGRLREENGSADAPRWTAVFESYPAAQEANGYTSQAVSVVWGHARKNISLTNTKPVRPHDTWPPPSPSLDDRAAIAIVEGLLQSFQTTTENGDAATFQRFTFNRVTESGSEQVNGIWRQHLLQLQQYRQDGLSFGQPYESRADKLAALAVHWNQQTWHLLLRNTLILDVDRVFVRTVVSAGSQQAPRVPDLPLRAEFAGLVCAGSEAVIHKLHHTLHFQLPNAAAVRADVEVQDGQVIWKSISLLGRSVPFSHGAKFHNDFSADGHWEVWPKFRSPAGSSRPWKSYYLFQQGSPIQDYNPSFRVRPLWLNTAGQPRLGRAQDDPKDHAYAQPWVQPIGWSNADRVDAGQPFALSLTDARHNEEHGLYWVRLTELGTTAADLSLSVDFGTSHSAAAWRNGTQDPTAIVFGQKRRLLGLPVLEDTELRKKALVNAAWLPTEAEDGAYYLPTELATTGSVNQAIDNGAAAAWPDPATWIPGRDFRIPNAKVDRRVVEERSLSSFKWTLEAGRFQGQEEGLRKHYLSHFLELALARILDAQAQFPAGRPVKVTFLWPLRSTISEANTLRHQMEDLLDRMSSTTGLDLTLDRSGLMDESRASRVRDLQHDRYDLVADLGGGTLDIFLAADNHVGERPPFVAESLKFGVNHLLKLLASEPDCLPTDWALTSGDKLPLLRSWMRTSGSPNLFGEDPNLGVVRNEELSLSSFVSRAEGSVGRDLIDRYFGLVSDYLARTLVSYAQLLSTSRGVALEQAQFRIQLRGNGWRVNYHNETVAMFSRKFASLVQQRAAALALNEGISGSVAQLFATASKVIALPADNDEALKQYPVCNTLFTAERLTPDNAFEGITTFTTGSLNRQSDQSIVQWYQPLPVQSANQTDLTFSGALSPAVLLRTDGATTTEVSRFEAQQTHRVNLGIHGGIYNHATKALHARMAAHLLEPVLLDGLLTPRKTR